MKKNIFLIFLIFLLSGFISDEIKLSTITLVPGIKAKIPVDFTLLTDDELASKYLTPRKPLAVFSSPDRMVDFGVNKSITQFREEDMEIVKGFYKGSIQSMFDDVKFLKEEIRTINDKKFIAFEFVSVVKDRDDIPSEIRKKTTNYTYIQYAIHNGKTYVFNFSCPAQVKDIWQPVADQIMQSIKINKTLK